MRGLDIPQRHSAVASSAFLHEQQQPKILTYVSKDGLANLSDITQQGQLLITASLIIKIYCNVLLVIPHPAAAAAAAAVKPGQDTVLCGQSGTGACVLHGSSLRQK